MLHYKYKPVGLFLILIGIALTCLYFIHRVDISIPVFAIHSSYLETHFFKIIKNNFSEELIFLSFLIGFLLLSFSREKSEFDDYAAIRGQVWQKAIRINTFVLIFCTLFVYGAGFAAILIVNVFSTFVFYNLLFTIKKRKFIRTMNSKNQ